METQVKRSVCPFDCPDACGLIVTVAGGKAVQVEGDPEHPFNRGSLCVKMRHYERTVHSPLRLTTPLVRVGAKGEARFSPVSWDEALALIARRLQDIVSRYGAEAILPYSYAGTMGLIQRNAGHAFFHRLGASRLLRTICSPAKDAAWVSVMGETPALDPAEVVESDLIILWGLNAAATNVHFLPLVREAKKKGAPVWLIETYETPTANIADRVFLVRPGSDGALALAMMQVLIREGRLDRDFLAGKVRGFELLQKEIHSYPPAWAADITGLQPEVIEEMALAYGRARAPFIRLGSGLTRYGNGAMNARIITCLPALTGAYARRGGGCFHGTRTQGAFALGEVTREDFLAYPTRQINMNQLGEALNKATNPPVKALFVYSSNPLAVAPDQNAVLAGLSRKDLFTVVHERFLTDTAEFADVVLPATSSLEQDDLFRSYGTYFIQRAFAIIPPVGESKSNLELFSLLARAMGFAEPFFGLTAADLVECLLTLPHPWREGIDRQALEEGRAVRLKLPAGAALAYGTPSGRIEIFNPRLREPLPRYLTPHSQADRGKLHFLPAVTPYALNSSFYEQKELREKQGGMLLQLNPLEAAPRGLADGEEVLVENDWGQAVFILKITDKVPVGAALAEGIWWRAFSPSGRTVNALTSQRLTDMGEGSTFYDQRVDVRKRSRTDFPS